MDLSILNMRLKNVEKKQNLMVSLEFCGFLVVSNKFVRAMNSNIATDF